MATIDWTDRLSEYLDETLTPEERRACEAWLESSAEGRTLLQDLRRVVAKAKTLPDRPVPEAVWQGVAAGIRKSAVAQPAGTGVVDLTAARAARPARRWSLTPMQFAAAAVVVLAAGVTAGIALRGRGAGPERVAQAPGFRPPVTTGTAVTPVVASRANESYDRAVDELQGILDRNRSNLDTATVRVLERSLAKIDAALTEAQQALANDPRNAYLIDHLTRIKRKKLDLLRQGASLVRAS